MQNITKTMETGSFSAEQLAGQRLMVGFDGQVFNDDLQTLICDLKVGGVILFARNLGNPEQIQVLCTAIQDCAKYACQPPLFIATDQEGGQVARMKAPFTLFPGNPMITAEADAEHFAKVTAAELAGVGINMNMAPVLDVDCKAIKSVMASRAFSDDPQQVSDLGVHVIRHLQQNGIMAVAKHFPGIGRTTADSHFTRPFLDTELKTLELTDLTPFKAAVNEAVAGVMLSHIVYTGVDPDWPASLSDHIVRILLRQKLGYEGVIITDDLDMGAIKKHYDIIAVIRRIVKADIDIALICHKGPDIETAYNLIVNELNASTSAKHRGVISVERIMKLKQMYLV